MTVYVDDMNLQAAVPNGGHAVRGKWSHLFADTEAELRAFARQIGLRPGWIQHPGTHDVHFDVTAGKRQQAIARGAQAVTWREAGEFFAQRAQAAKAQPVKRHRWPKREPGERRAHDQCLDCGTWTNDAKGGKPCTARQAEPQGKHQRHSWTADSTTPGNMKTCGRDGCGMVAEQRAHPTEKRWLTIYSKGGRRIVSERVPPCGSELPEGASAEDMTQLATAADREAATAYRKGDLDRAFRLLTDARVLDPGRTGLWDAHEQRIRTAARHRQAPVPVQRLSMDDPQVREELQRWHEWNKELPRGFCGWPTCPEHGEKATRAGQAEVFTEREGAA